MSGVDASSAVGVLCYGLSTGYGIRFTEHAAAPIAAALAPPVLILALSLNGSGPICAFAGCLLAAVVVGLLLRRPLRDLLRHSSNLCLTAGSLVALRSAVDDLLILALSGAAIYLAADYLAQRLRAHQRLLPRADMTTWWLLLGVLLSACGLTALAVSQLDWPAFLAMALVLVLTKREFEAFAKSRAAYAQTLRAVARLKEMESPISVGE
jgi:hypothetical protein